MSRKKFKTLRELEEYWDNDIDIDEEEPDGTIDIVELPPDKADEVSDLEDIDDNILEDTIPNDVPGSLEIHGGKCNEEFIVPRKKKPKKEKPISKWNRKSASYNISTHGEEECKQREMNMINAIKDKTPVEVFEMFFTDELVNYIVQQSVSYAAQNNRHQFTLSADCIKKFLGFLLLTGYHSLPQEQMYWSEDEDINLEIVRKCMTKNRYIDIKRNLHFCNNASIPNINGNKDRLFKIRPILDELNKRFMQFGVFSYNLCIDEQMVRYYGHHYLKQFIRGKPIRFGFKQWAMCCGVTGYCYNAEIYEGQQTNNLEKDTHGLGMSVILNKIATIHKPEEHCFYFDNFFTSFDLMKNLKERNIPATGTVRCNRMNKCPIKTDKEMKKEFRGAFDYRYDEINEIFCLVWKDNSIVKMLSNHLEVLPLGRVQRWSRTEKKQVLIPQPNAIANYNKNMGGVDKLDWNIQKYRTKIRGKKWYFPIFTNAVDMALVNAHTIYNIANKKMPLLNFRREVARFYLSLHSLSDPKNSGRPSYSISSQRRVPDEVRKNSKGHYLERTLEGKQRKCAVCKKNVRKQCVKCDVGLHVECVIQWHS